MRLRGALLWEADGEPRRDEVLISDERPNDSVSRIVILDRGGQPRAASPQELPVGSVLLLPPDASDRDVDRIHHSGYRARRGAELVLGNDVPPSQFVRVLAHALPLVLVKGNGALNLIAELGGEEATAEWLAELANEVGHPVGINLRHGDVTRTILIPPSSWSEERLRGWTAGYKDEIETALGEMSLVPFDESPGEADDLAESPADRRGRRAAIKAAEAELEEVTERLKRVLRQRHPELFDARGELRPDAYARVIRERTGDGKYLSREEFIELTGGRMAPADESSSTNAPYCAPHEG